MKGPQIFTKIKESYSESYRDAPGGVNFSEQTLILISYFTCSDIFTLRYETYNLGHTVKNWGHTVNKNWGHTVN